MKCKHEKIGEDLVSRYAKETDGELREVLRAFNAPHWREYYRGNHRSQAYRRKFFKLGRERGVSP